MTQSNTKKAIDVTKLVPPKTLVIDTPKKYIDDYQFNVLGNITTDSSTSCDLEEAVAKMLGWLSGSLRMHPDDIDIRNITLAQMPYLPYLYYSLDDHIEMLIEKAGDNFIAADKDPEVSQEIKAKTIEAVLNCEDLSAKALAYKCAIEAELAKENKSALKVDVQKTNEQNEIFITLDSLNFWVKEEFGITIFDNHLVIKNKSSKNSSQPQRGDSLRREIIKLLKTMQNPTPSEMMEVLRSRAGNQNSCITNNVGDGVQWENDKGNVKKLTIDALAERLKTLKTPD